MSNAIPMSLWITLKHEIQNTHIDLRTISTQITTILTKYLNHLQTSGLFYSATTVSTVKTRRSDSPFMIFAIFTYIRWLELVKHVGYVFNWSLRYFSRIFRIEIPAIPTNAQPAELRNRQVRLLPESKVDVTKKIHMEDKRINTHQKPFGLNTLSNKTITIKQTDNPISILTPKFSQPFSSSISIVPPWTHNIILVRMRIDTL